MAKGGIGTEDVGIVKALPMRYTAVYLTSKRTSRLRSL